MGDRDFQITKTGVAPVATRGVSMTCALSRLPHPESLPVEWQAQSLQVSLVCASAADSTTRASEARPFFEKERLWGIVRTEGN